MMTYAEAQSIFIVWDGDRDYPMFLAFGGRWTYNPREAFNYIAREYAEMAIRNSHSEDCQVITLAEALDI